MYEQYDVDVIQGDTWNDQDVIFQQEIDGVFTDFTGWAARLQLRATIGATPVLDITDGDGLVIDTTKIYPDVSATITAEIPTGYYIYALKVTSPGGSERTLTGGKWGVYPEVTA